jgi:hypothetical protein
LSIAAGGTTIFVMLLFLGAVAAGGMFVGQVRATGGAIIISGADYNSTIITQYSSNLVGAAGNVTPRMFVEYADSTWNEYLNSSSDLQQKASTVSARIFIEYADFELGLGLGLSNDLRPAANIVTPRIMIEYADYASAFGFAPYLGPNNASDSSLPTVGIPTRDPSGNVTDGQSVIVSVDVSDAESGVKNATLQYNNDSAWYPVPMSLNLSVFPKDSLSLSYFATIPGQTLGTNVSFRVVAWDYAGHDATSIDGTPYTVVPEFPSTMILSLFMIAALFAVIAYRRRYRLTARNG